MASIVRTVLRGGASAARIRGTLRAVTQPVRRANATRVVAMLGRVSGALPATVLGDDLIRLMSGPLQSALRLTRPVASDARAPRRTADFRAANTLHAAKEARNASPALRTSDSWRLPWGSPEGAARTGDAAFVDQRSSRDQGTGRRSIGESHPSIRPTGRDSGSAAFQDARGAPGRASFTSANFNPANIANGAVDARVNSYDRALVPALTAKLREYWQLTRGEQAQRSRAADASTPSSAQTSTRRFDEAAASRARPDEEYQAAQSVEQTLLRFGSGRLLSEANAFRARPSLSSVTSPTGSSDLHRRGDLNEARPGLLTTVAPTWDLSDHLADILREQALQHGIDLT